MNHTKDMRIIPSFYPLFHKGARGDLPGGQGSHKRAMAYLQWVKAPTRRKG